MVEDTVRELEKVVVRLDEKVSYLTREVSALKSTNIWLVRAFLGAAIAAFAAFMFSGGLSSVGLP